ncbi:putative bifunctional diguanylate cyclase/phosphodiesterase [Phenylobacterium soli]|uniref:putative bifunctional diguanylate cyclase/phosphodiesterase n=1 Tax=Phenylobacterium soli TaxID=2170551 RepID=UPI001057E706|nr:EAL domain-containing protein [Phenylobacterium soli]
MGGEVLRRDVGLGEEPYRDLLMATADYLWQVDADGVLRELVARDSLPLQYEPGELIGRPVLDLTPEGARAALGRRLSSQLAARAAVDRLDILVLRKDGVETTLEVSARPIFDAGGVFRGYLGAAREVGDIRASRRELEYRDRLRVAVARAASELVGAASVQVGAPRALGILGEAMKLDRLLVFENRAEQPGPVALLFNWSASEVPAKDAPLGEPLQDDGGEWTQAMRAGRAYVAQAGEVDGLIGQLLDFAGAKTILFAPISVAGDWWGTLTADDCKSAREWTAAEKEVLTMFAEIVGASILRERHQLERARAEQALNLSSHHDTLTGLVSRKLFSERLDRAIGAVASGGPRFAVLYVDLDHFKDVNDTLGHPVGDVLLQAVAERLRSVTREGDVVARFGGDEFAVLQFGVARPEDAAGMAREIIEVLKEPFRIAEHNLHMGASIGIALQEAGAARAETMLSHAELALYRAKAEGRRTYRFFTAAMDTEARRRVVLADELRRGLAGGEFFLVYQPQVDMRQGRIIGVEALVRWRHPTRGVVSPAEFIPAAESNGLIVQLGEWVLRAAAYQTRAWMDRGLAPPSVSVNVSPIQFRHPEQLEDFIGALVRETGLPRGVLQLELTESALMEASMAQADVLDRLHRQGLKISLDDFGTGYSSLDYLHRYRVDEIKIAQEFVQRMVDNRGDGAIVRAAISLAQALELRVLAEGVERADQAKMLADWGCHEVQGFYFARPLPADEVEKLLAQRTVKPASAPVA